MEFESKNLFVNISGTGIAFRVTPFKQEESDNLAFKIDMGDHDPKAIHHSYINGWWQLSGKQIYTDILHMMGAMIEKNYPELF